MQVVETEERKPILVSPTLLEMLSEKKHQYRDRHIKFETHFAPDASFCWINIAPSPFKRALSNLINNAVDSCTQSEGVVQLHLDADASSVRIIIEDNGKGMSPELVQTILDKIAVTEGKTDGHGIGLTQVRDTLRHYDGQWKIESQVGVGSRFELCFPRVPSMDWIAQTIAIRDNDILVIVDDDESIHMAWDLRFKDLLKEYPELTLRHFTYGQEAIDFVKHHNQQQLQQQLILLTDYELIKQGLTGLDVIEQTRIRNPVLVTSHFANPELQRAAGNIGAKILPKQLALDVDVLVTKSLPEYDCKLPCDLRRVDAVLVDDDFSILDSFMMLAGDVKIDAYQNPQFFLDNLHRYPKHTRILLDHHYNNYAKKGIQIAEQLHALGYTQLHLLTGGNLGDFIIPDYLSVTIKSDIAIVKKLLRGSEQLSCI